MSTIMPSMNLDPMNDLWQRIREETNKHGYMSGVDRKSERIKKTAEVFTPTDLVIEMLQEILKNDSSALAPGKTVIDPSCGDGQFLVPVKLYKMWHHQMNEEDALKDIYGVDIMRDNVELCKKRLNASMNSNNNILLGDTLHPEQRIEGQTEEEHRRMKELFILSDESEKKSSASLSAFF